MGGKEGRLKSVINIVDLAGSEKSGQAGTTGDRLAEGNAINRSLSALGNVITVLAEHATGKNLRGVVPYRDSTLTRMLHSVIPVMPVMIQNALSVIQEMGLLPAPMAMAR